MATVEGEETTLVSRGTPKREVEFLENKRTGPYYEKLKRGLGLGIFSN